MLCLERFYDIYASLELMLSLCLFKLNFNIIAVSIVEFIYIKILDKNIKSLLEFLGKNQFISGYKTSV